MRKHIVNTCLFATSVLILGCPTREAPADNEKGVGEEVTTEVTPPLDVEEQEVIEPSVSDASQLPNPELAYPCPVELEGCYQQFASGQECTPGKLVARFTLLPYGGENQCSQPGKADTDLQGCLFYQDPVATLSYCCNGYIANRSTAIVDAPLLECCFEALNSEYGKLVDHGAKIDGAGVHNPGLDVSAPYPDLHSEDVVCAQWYRSTGVSTNGYIHGEDDISLLYYPAIVVQDAEHRILYCDYSADPVDAEPLELQNLDLLPGTVWTDSVGDECYEIQESAYH